MKRRSFLQLLGLSPALSQFSAPVEAAPNVVPEVDASKGPGLYAGHARLRLVPLGHIEAIWYRMDAVLDGGIIVNADAHISDPRQKPEMLNVMRDLLRNEIRHQGAAISAAYPPASKPGEESEYIAL